MEQHHPHLVNLDQHSEESKLETARMQESAQIYW